MFSLIHGITKLNFKSELMIKKSMLLTFFIYAMIKQYQQN